MSDETIGVIGGGIMGSGIAQVCALAGLSVALVDISEVALAKALASIDRSLERQVDKGTLTGQQRIAALGRISTSSDYASLSDAGLVIEAATENLDLKLCILKQISEQVGAEAIIASNTSSLSISQLAAQVQRPERFIGLHFFNPVALMTLVEVIRGLATAEVFPCPHPGVRRAHWQDPRSAPVTARASWSTGFWCRCLNRSHLHPAGRPGHCRGYRYRHAARLRPAHGAVGAGGPDWSGYSAGDSGVFPTGVRRFQIPARPPCSGSWWPPVASGARAVMVFIAIADQRLPGMGYRWLFPRDMWP